MPSSSDHLSLAEAKEFLENTLQLQLPMDRLKEDRAGFLRDVITSCHRRIPFQSVTAIATPRPERRRLTLPEIKALMMTGMGGLCFEMNHFFKLLLETLGFKVDHIGSKAFGIPNFHMANVVRDLNRPGDLHLADIGSAFPLFEPIPLNFEKESPVYRESFLVHQFVKEDDGSLRWMHQVYKEYADIPPEQVVDGWYPCGRLNLEVQDFEDFTDRMETVHTVEDGPLPVSQFLTSLRAVDFRNGRLFAIKDTTILEEDASGTVTKKRLSGPKELLEAYKVHFPQFPVETVQRAVQTVNLKFES